MTTEYQVWQCKIVVPKGAKLPKGFDFPPRRAAINTVTDHGIDVLSCFSGWAAELTEGELAIVRQDEARRKNR